VPSDAGNAICMHDAMARLAAKRFDHNGKRQSEALHGAQFLHAPKKNRPWTRNLIFDHELLELPLVVEHFKRRCAAHRKEDDLRYSVSYRMQHAGCKDVHADHGVNAVLQDIGAKLSTELGAFVIGTVQTELGVLSSVA
jgi:hypothetical protein